MGVQGKVEDMILRSIDVHPNCWISGLRNQQEQHPGKNYGQNILVAGVQC